MRKGVHGPLARSGNTPPPDFIYEPPVDVGLNVLHQDSHILVLSKPANLLSVSGSKPEHKDSLELRAQSEFPEARIVHRLDRGTSGVIIMAMNAQAHRHLGLQFEKRKTAKTYLALVAGEIEQDEGVIELPLRTDWYNRPKQMVDKCLGRDAVTHWKVLERKDGITRVQLIPTTGRSHQLRVHMQELGHPILGDSFYAPVEVVHMAKRLMLHAEKLEVSHPVDGERIQFCDPCPY